MVRTFAPPPGRHPLYPMRISCLLAALCLAVSGSAQPAPAPVTPVKYALTADSLPQPGVPPGRLEGPFEFHSTVISGTVRRYWIFVPAQYRPGTAASLLVFQDGQRATNPQGVLCVPTVLANLIHQGDIPVTIGVFITPGHRADRYPDDLGMQNPNHRSPEYDALNETYARMLIDELLPVVAERYTLTDDPAERVIGGTSSGAICAFTVAWHRPDYFRKVISMIGSYVSIGYRPAEGDRPMVPGGDLYPTLIRKTPIKPLRVFLQGGAHDLNNDHGNWFLANQQMLAALHYANQAADRRGDPGPRYDVTHVWGEGGHSDDHGGSLLPEMLRWMWRDGSGSAPGAFVGEISAARRAPPIVSGGGFR
jgi:hypothetical protein